jgi:hypothetical protein
LTCWRDTINSIKQAAEFGIVKGGQSLAGFLSSSMYTFVEMIVSPRPRIRQ